MTEASRWESRILLFRVAGTGAGVAFLREHGENIMNDMLPLPFGEATVLAPGEVHDDEYLAQAEGRIRGYGKLVVSGLVEIGRELVAVKERVGHGRYEAFVRDRLRWSTQSAWNYTNVFERLKSLTVGDLDGLTIDASSLYLIAAPSTPSQVRDQVLDQAAKPEGISRQEVEKLIGDARAETEKATRAEYDDKIVLSDDELEKHLIKIDRKYQKRVKSLEKECDTITKQRDTALANLKSASAKRETASPLLKTFDSATSFRAMCIAQAVKALRDELKITPQQLVDIEREMAETIHAQPELAVAKLADLQTNARPIVDWLKELLAVLEAPR